MASILNLAKDIQSKAQISWKKDLGDFIPFFTNGEEFPPPPRKDTFLGRLAARILPARKIALLLAKQREDIEGLLRKAARSKDKIAIAEAIGRLTVIIELFELDEKERIDGNRKRVKGLLVETYPFNYYDRQASADLFAGNIVTIRNKLRTILERN